MDDAATTGTAVVAVVMRVLNGKDVIAGSRNVVLQQQQEQQQQQ